MSPAYLTSLLTWTDGDGLTADSLCVAISQAEHNVFLFNPNSMLVL